MRHQARQHRPLGALKSNYVGSHLIEFGTVKLWIYMKVKPNTSLVDVRKSVKNAAEFVNCSED